MKFIFIQKPYFGLINIKNVQHSVPTGTQCPGSIAQCSAFSSNRNTMPRVHSTTRCFINLAGAHSLLRSTGYWTETSTRSNTSSYASIRLHTSWSSYYLFNVAKVQSKSLELRVYTGFLPSTSELWGVRSPNMI